MRTAPSPARATLAVGVFVLVGVAVSTVAMIVGIVWTVLTGIATLLVLASLTYATIRGVRWLRLATNYATRFSSASRFPSTNRS